MSHRSETITVVLESPPAPGAPQLKVLGPRDLASRSLCSNCQATDADLRPDKAHLALQERHGSKHPRVNMIKAQSAQADGPKAEKM